MAVPDVVEELDLVFGEEEANGEGVDGGVAPAFVEELRVGSERASYEQCKKVRTHPLPTPPHLSR